MRRKMTDDADFTINASLAIVTNPGAVPGA
jgi:hypothetical protein